MDELSLDRRAEVLQFALFLRDKQKQQAGRQPVRCLEELWGDFWPEDEPVDDFVDAVRRWRKQDVSLHED